MKKFKRKTKKTLPAVSREESRKFGWILKMNLIEQKVPFAEFRKVFAFPILSCRKFLALITRMIRSRPMSYQDFWEGSRDAKTLTQ